MQGLPAAGVRRGEVAAHCRHFAQPPICPGHLLRPVDPHPSPSFACVGLGVPGASPLLQPAPSSGPLPEATRAKSSFLPCRLSPASALSGPLFLSPSSSAWLHREARSTAVRPAESSEALQGGD